MAKENITIGGMLYAGNGTFYRGYIKIKNHEIVEVNTGTSPYEDYTGVVLPKFINAHTHVGDAIVQEEPKGSLTELVAPPDGLKFKYFREKRMEEKIQAMKTFIKSMVPITALFVDFREEGVSGVQMLRSALEGASISAIILGRPAENEKPESILTISDGIAMSAVSDWDFNYLKGLSENAKALGKMFAMHGSERIREPIRRIIALKPSFIVHMCKATESDIQICAKHKIPIVVCPRSNAMFGNFPDVQMMLKNEVMLMLGTDNAMLNTPSLFREMEFLYKCRFKGYIQPEKILSMAIDTPWNFFMSKKRFFESGELENLFVLDVPGTSPAYQVVARGGEHLISYYSVPRS